MSDYLDRIAAARGLETKAISFFKARQKLRPNSHSGRAAGAGDASARPGRSETAAEAAINTFRRSVATMDATEWNSLLKAIQNDKIVDAAMRRKLTQLRRLYDDNPARALDGLAKLLR